MEAAIKPCWCAQGQARWLAAAKAWAGSNTDVAAKAPLAGWLACLFDYFIACLLRALALFCGRLRRLARPGNQALRCIGRRRGPGRCRRARGIGGGRGFARCRCGRWRRRLAGVSGRRRIDGGPGRLRRARRIGSGRGVYLGARLRQRAAGQQAGCQRECYFHHHLSFLIMSR